MNKYFACMIALLCANTMSGGVDAYGFYVYGFQGCDASDSSMKQILASAWDQLPEATDQQKNLKQRLAERFEKKFTDSIEKVIEKLPRLSQLQNQCDTIKTNLTHAHDQCQVHLNDSKKTATTLNANLGDIKDIKEKLDAGLAAIRNAEDKFKQSKIEEVNSLDAYTTLLNDQNGAGQLPGALERMKAAYKDHADAIKALQQACADISIPITLEVSHEHIIIEGLIGLE
jgi:chromosome segregation ATPase